MPVCRGIVPQRCGKYRPACQKLFVDIGTRACYNRCSESSVSSNGGMDVETLVHRTIATRWGRDGRGGTPIALRRTAPRGALGWPALLGLDDGMGPALFRRGRARAERSARFNKARSAEAEAHLRRRRRQRLGVKRAARAGDYSAIRKNTAAGGETAARRAALRPAGHREDALARALAGEARVPFFALSAPTFVEKYVGVGAMRVRELFKAAKAGRASSSSTKSTPWASAAHQSADERDRR